jgi:hypothetical protein
VDNFLGWGLGHFGGIKGTARASMSREGTGSLRIDCLLATRREVNDIKKTCEAMIAARKQANKSQFSIT